MTRHPLSTASLAACLVVLSGVPALAVGSEDPVPPRPSETTTTCPEGFVFDVALQRCMTPERSTNDQATLYGILRELAHVGRYDDALAVLALMQDQGDPAVLTYYGFVTRKTGDVAAGMAFYEAALAVDPAFHLARSYMGQAFVEAGNPDAARAQLSEMRARGGRGTWAELSLRMAIERGRGFTY